MTLDTFFKKFDTFADAPDAVAKMRAPLPGCVMRRAGNPVVSLRSTTGYMLSSLRDLGLCHDAARFRDAMNPVAHASTDMIATSSDAGGIPACSRWSSEARATPPDHRPPSSRTPAGVSAHPALP